MPNGWEWAILVLIALLLLGGARLSGVGGNVGRSIREFKAEIAAPRKQTADGQAAEEHDGDPTPEPQPNIVVELSQSTEAATPSGTEEPTEVPSETDPA
jgi:TatA/E family protein of Tat protein translocase